MILANLMLTPSMASADSCLDPLPYHLFQGDQEDYQTNDDYICSEEDSLDSSAPSDTINLPSGDVVRSTRRKRRRKSDQSLNWRKAATR